MFEACRGCQAAASELNTQNEASKLPALKASSTPEPFALQSIP